MSTNGNGHLGTGTNVLEHTLETTATPHLLVHENELDKIPPTKYLVDEILPESKLCVLFGPPGGGKSFIALNYGLIVAQDAPVIYVAAEGFSGYSKRKNAWYKHHKKGSGQMYFTADPVLLMDSSNVSSFILSAKAINPKLIIFDTLAWCLSGGDENSAKDMGVAIAACRKIQHETNAAILLVHHTVKRGIGERGSSALRGGADMMLELSNSDDVITLSCSKSKDSEPFQPKHFRLVQVETPQGTSCVVLPAEKVIPTANSLTTSQREILELLALEIFGEKGARSQQIIASVSIATSTVYKVLNNLVTRGLVRQAKKGDPFYITPQGKALIDV